MGEVYQGFDTRLQRQVAVKTLRAGHRPDADMKARFLREARLLSQIDHPAICKVYDLIEGHDADYLIFELVEGETLKQKHRSGSLGRADILGLGEKIAEALVAAHYERIVHRDLKPDNIMVTPEGGIKILDFGISTVLNEPHTSAALAQLQQLAVTHAFMDAPETVVGAAVDLEDGPTVRLQAEGSVLTTSDIPTHRLGEPDGHLSDLETQLTRHGLILGTINYMSPEQARGEKVTSACDLYAFGILLQELLTDRRAYDRKEPAPLLAQVANGESRPMEDEDPAIVSLVEDLKRRNPELRPTAVQAAERIRHALDAPSRQRRRRLQWSLVAASFAALLGVLIVVFSLYQKATAEAERANSAVAMAKEERDRAQATTELLVETFQMAAPDQARGREITARDLLFRGAENLEKELDGEPLLLAGMQQILGGIMLQLAAYPNAQELLESSLRLRRQHAPDDHLAIGQSLLDLGALSSDRKQSEEALSLLREARRELEQVDNPRARLVLAAVFDELGNVSQDLGRFSEAGKSYQRALKLRQIELGPEAKEVADTLNNLASLSWRLGDLAEAGRRFEEILNIYERLYPDDDHPNLAAVLSNLGLVYRGQASYAQAEKSFVRALDISRRSLGEDHPQVGSVLFSLGRLHLYQERLEEAASRFEQSLRIRRRAFGLEHYECGRSLIWIGEAQRGLGRLDAAWAAHREGHEMMTAAEGKNYFHRYETLLLEANLARSGQDEERAMELYDSAALLAETMLGKDHREVRAIRRAKG